MTDLKAAIELSKSVRTMALEEAALVAEQGCLVPPDGGSPTEAEAELCKEIAARIRALKSSPAHPHTDGWRVPEGWKLVPVEPSERMMKAGEVQLSIPSWRRLLNAYNAMLSTSPPPPNAGGR